MYRPWLFSVDTIIVQSGDTFNQKSTEAETGPRPNIAAGGRYDETV
jgi:hypothetical protein